MIRSASRLAAAAASAFLIAAPLVLPAGPATAQDTRALADRMQRLERDLGTLQQQVYGGRPGGAPMPPMGSDVEGSPLAAQQVRIGQVENEVRGLTGQLEEITFGIGQLKQRLDRLVTDVDFRLAEMEKALGERGSAAQAGSTPGAAQTAAVPARGSPPPPGVVAPAAAPRQQTAAAPSAVRLPAGSPKDQYEFAFDLLKRADYAGAEQALKSFVSAHPADPLAGNAQYWLAETYYVRNNFDEAAAQFLQGYQKYPKSPKAADNLFKLGLSLANLNRVPAACAAFGRFDKEYPTALASLRRRVVEERQRLACTG